MIWNWQQPDWPNWRFDSRELATMERQFVLDAGRLQGAWAHLSLNDQVVAKIELLSAEALKTSEIEGEFLDRASVQSSIRKQFGLQADRRSGPAENGIAQLMVANHEQFQAPLTHEMLHQWHKLICNGRQDLEFLGQYRAGGDPMQVVSGPIGRRKVHFEAPLSDTMTNEMSAFIDWFNETDEPPLVRAGLAHLWFVSVHPFEDGNGRLARALSDKALAQAVGTPTLLALSNQIRKERKNYYAALEANNKSIEMSDWLVWFAETVIAAQQFSADLLQHLITKTKVLDQHASDLNPRQLKALIRMFDAGPEGFIGGMSAKNYISITGASPATARRDLNHLANRGILTKTGTKSGTRYWLASIAE